LDPAAPPPLKGREEYWLEAISRGLQLVLSEHDLLQRNDFIPQPQNIF
jgi:hypothetical protein